MDRVKPGNPMKTHCVSSANKKPEEAALPGSLQPLLRQEKQILYQNQMKKLVIEAAKYKRTSETTLTELFKMGLHLCNK